MESLYVAVIAASFSMIPVGALDCVNDVCAAVGHRHVLCEHPDPKPSASCGTVYETGMTDSEINVTITALNDVRMKVAMGLETRGAPGPQPAAADMRIMVWDEELALIAQRWIDQCVSRYAKCVDVDRFTVGQTIVALVTNHDQFSMTVPDMIVHAIHYVYSQVEHMDSRRVCNYRYDPATYAYTQLVWAKTSRVGCGRIIYRKGQLFHRIMCVHGPRGNLEGKPIYHVIRS